MQDTHETLWRGDTWGAFIAETQLMLDARAPLNVPRKRASPLPSPGTGSRSFTFLFLTLRSQDGAQCSRSIERDRPSHAPLFHSTLFAW